ncbi:hypothetical protein CHUAL_006622 [Chamberlinius hualienensis]
MDNFSVSHHDHPITFGHMNQTGEIDYVVFPRAATIFAAISCIIFVVIGAAGNFVTVLALSRSVKLRNNATTAFVISLSLADLLFCSINLPLTASRYIHEAWVLGDVLCALFPFFFYGNMGVSLLSMTAITINRYILIAHHQYYNAIYQKRYIVLMIAFVWAFSFAILLPPLTKTWGQLGLSPETFSCTILPLNGHSPKKFLFLFGFLLPCIVIVLSYSCIFYKVRRSRHNVASHCPKTTNGHAHNGTNGNGHFKSNISSTSSTQWSEDLRLTRLMLVIFCSFLVCFLPLMLANVVDDNFTIPTLHLLASVLAYASSVINPFIYAVLNRQYRKAYARVFRCRDAFTVGDKGRRSASSNTNSATNSGGGKTVGTEVFQYTVVANKINHDIGNSDGEVTVPLN